MNKKMLKEVLAAHADRLVKGEATGKDYRQLLPEQDEELAPLMGVAELVQSTLKPITPANKFEQQLKQDLLNIAQQRQVEGYIPPNPARDLFFLVATTAFILALTGVLIAIRRRSDIATKDQEVNNFPVWSPKVVLLGNKAQLCDSLMRNLFNFHS